MMVESHDVGKHLVSCFDAVYLGLGECAPKLSTDAYVVRVHEMARAFGEIALELRAYVGRGEVAPLAVIGEVLDQALEKDPSGAMTLFAMALVVGPRLLVSLRDAREGLGPDAELRTICERAAQVTVQQLLQIANTTQHHEDIDDPGWQEGARRLTQLVESAGNAESFGISR
jgi:hypothetical protein